MPGLSVKVTKVTHFMFFACENEMNLKQTKISGLSFSPSFMLFRHGFGNYIACQIQDSYKHTLFICSRSKLNIQLKTKNKGGGGGNKDASRKGS